MFLCTLNTNASWQRKSRRTLQWPLSRWYFQSVQKMKERKIEQRAEWKGERKIRERRKKDTSFIKDTTSSIIWSTSGVCFQSHSYITHICISSMSLTVNQKKIIWDWRQTSVDLIWGLSVPLLPAEARNSWCLPISVLLCCALKPLKLCMHITNLRVWQLT